MKKVLISATMAVLAMAACHNPKQTVTDYRQIAIVQNELILLQEEKIEELATVINQTFPAYRTDYSEIDSLNFILDTLYTHSL